MAAAATTTREQTGLGSFFNERSEWSQPKVDFAAALVKLGVDASRVVGMYLLGSRLWGTATQDSDFDLFVIVKDGTMIADKKGIEHHCMHTAGFDAVVMTQRSFGDRLTEGKLYEHLIWHLTAIQTDDILRSFTDPQKEETVFYRRFAIMLPPGGFQTLLGAHHRNWKFSAESLTQCASKTLDRDWRIAEKHFSKGEAARGRKIIIHSLRMLIMVTQLLKGSASFVDLTKGIRIFQRMQRDHSYTSSWDVIFESFSPIRDRLLSEMCT